MTVRAWQIEPQHEQSKVLARELDIHPQIASLLFKRGFVDNSQNLSFSLEPSLQNLQSPYEFTHMRKAVDRIRKAISDQSRILLYGDYDVDGVTGSAVLYPTLQKLGACVEVFIPNRVEDGYGLNLKTMQRLLEQQPFDLLITVDNGITACEVVDFLRQKNIDTIIVDHHMPKDNLPNAYAIVSVAVSPSADKTLAACGVAFKLVWALTDSLASACEYLDIVTIGTVADVAPVTGDNRILLKHGLNHLKNTKNKGLRALIRQSRLNPMSITYRDIGFVLAPRINAAGRMASAMEAFTLLCTTDELKAQNLATLLESYNGLRQRSEAQAFEDALSKLNQDARPWQSDPVLVVWDKNWHEGVVGIVASRLVERFAKPSIVLAGSQQEGCLKGSGRSIEGFSILSAVKGAAQHVNMFGGHDAAMGLSLDEGKVDIFCQSLQDYVIKQKDNIPHEALRIDAEIDFSQLNTKFIKDLSALEPFGPGNPRPLFLSRGIRQRGITKKKGKDTLSCWLYEPKSNTTCQALGFRKYSAWLNKAITSDRDIVYQPKLVESMGIVSIQVEIEDWK